VLPRLPDQETTNDPVLADHANHYKVEKWTKDGLKVDCMLFAGSSPDKAREVLPRRFTIGRASG
jgi:hypothetical protein